MKWFLILPVCLSGCGFFYNSEHTMMSRSMASHMAEGVRFSADACYDAIKAKSNRGFDGADLDAVKAKRVEIANICDVHLTSMSQSALIAARNADSIEGGNLKEITCACVDFVDHLEALTVKLSMTQPVSYKKSLTILSTCGSYAKEMCLQTVPQSDLRPIQVRRRSTKNKTPASRQGVDVVDVVPPVPGPTV